MDNISASSSANKLFLQSGGDFLFLFYEKTNKHGEIQVPGTVIVTIIAKIQIKSCLFVEIFKSKKWIPFYVYWINYSNKKKKKLGTFFLF